MKVWEVMSQPSITLREDAGIFKARKIMRETSLRCLPIVDEKNRLKGFITRTDLLKVTSLKLDAPVKEFMRQYPKITLDMELIDAINKLKEYNLKAAPVINSINDETLRGTLSLLDILRVMRARGFTPKAKTVSEVLTTKFFKCDPDERITKIWSNFVNDNAPAILVMKEDRLWGIITPKDLIDRRSWFFARESEDMKTPGKVKRFMIRGPICASPHLPIDFVTDFILNNDFSLLPVIDDESNVIGVITQEDLVRAYIEGVKPEAIPVPPIPIPLIEEKKIEYASSLNKLKEVLIESAVEAPLLKLKVKDLMRREVFKVALKDTVAHAKNLMLRYKVDHLLAVDEKGIILGLVSKRNIIKKVGFEGPIWKRRSSDPEFMRMIMTPEPPKISHEASIEEAATQMVYNNTDALIVVDDEDKFLGIITKNDIVKAFAEHYSGVLVENIMQPQRIGVVHPHHSLNHVIRIMDTNYLDCVVVAEGDKPLGLISDSQLVFVPIEDPVNGIKSRRLVWIRKLIHGGRRRGRYVKITPLLAEDFMIQIPAIIKLGSEASEAAKLMIKHKVDGLPVISENGQIVGVISKMDIIRELARRFVATPVEKEKLREKIVEHGRKETVRE